MAHYSPVPLDFPEAHQFADLEGIKQDLEWIIRVSSKYSTYWKQLDFEIVEAIFISIIVKYGRIHTSGERRKIPEQWIKNLNTVELEKHEYFINVRNKYVAHSVNNFEENFAVAYVKNIRSTKPEFNQVQAQHSRVIGISEEDVKYVIVLAEKFLTQIKSLMIEEKKLLTDMVKQLDLEYYIHNDQPFTLSTQSEAGKCRSRKVLRKIKK